MNKKITRQEEAELPEFKSHTEARAWFKEKYGDDFMLTGVEPIGDQKCYFYNLVLDRKEFNRFMEEAQQTIIVSAASFIDSYQPVQIMEDGSIHIVH